VKKPAVVTFSGDLDIYAVEHVRATLAAIDGPVIVDLTDVHFVDSSALTEFIRLRKRVGEHVTLVVPSANIRRALTIVGFDTLFRVVRRREDA
jgi:anti-anti-sigma factor